MTNRINVLDKGFVRLVDHLGSDLTVVNSARVSFGKRKTEIDESDLKLIQYLAKNKHYSPFRHVQLQFHFKMPEFVARQYYKHIVGCNYTSHDFMSVDHAWNEISMRYTDASDFDFYIPELLRTQSQSNKQCSEGELDPETNEHLIAIYRDQIGSAFYAYHDLIEQGVAREMARCVLPLAVYTEFYFTASLQAIQNLISLRDHPHAQQEIREYAVAIKKLTLDVVPLSLYALLEAANHVEK